jgi:hypothetical protein
MLDPRDDDSRDRDDDSGDLSRGGRAPNDRRERDGHLNRDGVAELVVSLNARVEGGFFLVEAAPFSSPAVEIETGWKVEKRGNRFAGRKQRRRLIYRLVSSRE